MTRTRRLEGPDFVYRFVDTALGWSVVLQVLWRFDAPPTVDALTAMASRLSTGTMALRLVVPSVPLARPYWVPSSAVSDVVLDDVAVHTHSVGAWADDELYTAPLDAEGGRCWRLRGAPVDDGGFVLSLTALHLATDGRAMMSAAASAVSDAMQESTTPDTGTANLVTDAVDAVRQIATAGIGIGKAVATAVLPGGSDTVVPIEMPSKSPLHQRAPGADYAWATVSVDEADWQSAAKTHGGTPNSLFIAVVSGVLRTSGYAPLGRPVKVGVPVSQRVDGDERTNATAGVSVYLVDEPVAGGELGGIRRKCKDAFTALGAGRRPAMIHLQPLMQLLPASLVVKAVTSGSGIPDAVTSNLGSFPEELADIGGRTAESVSFRGIAQHVDPDLPYRFGEGVQSWLVQVGETVTFSVVAFDEDRFESHERLRRLLSDELTAWGVPHRIH